MKSFFSLFHGLTAGYIYVHTYFSYWVFGGKASGNEQFHLPSMCTICIIKMVMEYFFTLNRNSVEYLTWNVWQNSTFRGCLARVEGDERMMWWNYVPTYIMEFMFTIVLGVHAGSGYISRNTLNILSTLKDSHISYWFVCWRLEFWSVYAFPWKYFKDIFMAA